MAAGDLHRHRRLRDRCVRVDRPGGAAHEAGSRRHGEPLRHRRPLRRVVADPRGRRSLGVGRPAGAVPDRAPAGIRVHRRTGGPAPGRAADERAISTGRGRVLGRVLPRRPPRFPPPRPAGLDRELAARYDGRTARVSRPPARDGAEVSGSPLGSDRDLAGRGPTVGANTVRVRSRSPPPRLPGAVGNGVVAGRLPPLQPRKCALQRGRPDPVSVRVHGGAQPRRHPLPRSARRAAAASLRPATRARSEPRRRCRAARRDGGGGRRAGSRRLRPLRARGRHPPHRHRPVRRHHPHVRQRLVSGGSDPGPSRRPGGRRRHRRPRRHRRHGRGIAAHEPARSRNRGRDRLRRRPERDLDGERRGDVPVVHARARGRDETPVARRERIRRRRGRRRAPSAAQVRRCT